MPIWVMGRAYKALLAEGVVLKGVDMGDVGSRWDYEFDIIPVSVVGAEHGVLVSGVRVIVQQEREWHKDSRLY